MQSVPKDIYIQPVKELKALWGRIGQCGPCVQNDRCQLRGTVYSDGQVTHRWPPDLLLGRPCKTFGFLAGALEVLLILCLSHVLHVDPHPGQKSQVSSNLR